MFVGATGRSPLHITHVIARPSRRRREAKQSVVNEMRLPRHPEIIGAPRKDAERRIAERKKWRYCL